MNEFSINLYLIIKSYISSAVYRNTISSVFLITSALRISLVVSRECIRLKIIFLLLTLSPESIKLVTACPNTADSSSNKLPELRKYLITLYQLLHYEL